MSGIVKNLLFALLAAAVLYAGYVFFIKEDDTAISENAVAESQAAQDSREFLITLRQLNTVSFDEGLFVDPRFRSLVDYRRPVLVESVGRENPFEAL